MPVNGPPPVDQAWRESYGFRNTYILTASIRGKGGEFWVHLADVEAYSADEAQRELIAELARGGLRVLGTKVLDKRPEVVEPQRTHWLEWLGLVAIFLVEAVACWRLI